MGYEKLESRNIIKYFIYCIKLKFLDNINDLNTDQFCRSKSQNGINNENHFFDIFTSKNDLNDSKSKIYCQQQIVSQKKEFLIN
jgi:hypothetical protein